MAERKTRTRSKKAAAEGEAAPATKTRARSKKAAAEAAPAPKARARSEKTAAEGEATPAKKTRRRTPKTAGGGSAATRGAGAQAPPVDEAPTPLPEVPAAFRTPDVDAPPALPVAAGRETAVAMVAGPGEVFAWWELTADGVARARAALDDPTAKARLVLRVYVFGAEDEAGEAPVTRDEEIDEWLGRRHLRVDRPGAAAVVAVGLRSGEAFVGVARSLPVHLPRSGPGAEPPRFVDLSGGRPVPAGAEAAR